MKNNVLLLSEDFLKTNSTLSESVFGKWILPAIREAQSIGLRRIIGDCLYNTIVGMVADGSIKDEENATIKEFLDNYVTEYMLYQTQFELIKYLNVKLTNMGTVGTNDDHIQTLSRADIELFRNEFRAKADWWASRMVSFLKCCKDAFPSDECSCHKLIDVASTNIWLGGKRG